MHRDVVKALGALTLDTSQKLIGVHSIQRLMPVNQLCGHPINRDCSHNDRPILQKKP